MAEGSIAIPPGSLGSPHASKIYYRDETFSVRSKDYGAVFTFPEKPYAVIFQYAESGSEVQWHSHLLETLASGSNLRISSVVMGNTTGSIFIYATEVHMTASTSYTVTFNMPRFEIYN